MTYSATLHLPLSPSLLRSFSLSLSIFIFIRALDFCCRFKIAKSCRQTLMGRPPSNGSPAFRFTKNEVSEMEAILDEHSLVVPPYGVLISITEKFSNSVDRIGKVAVQVKQVWNWFRNKRYALRAKFNKASGPAKLSVSTMPREDLIPTRNLISTMPAPAPSIMSAGRNLMDNAHLDFEAKSVRDGAWYDVLAFLSHRYFEMGDPEVLVRFAGFGPSEDEWVNVRNHIKQRSLPCESSECVVVLPGDLVLCFQEGKEQALYFDARVVDAQRWRHDIRGCHCRFLVRYDHDQFEEIVPLRKVCRRPETDYRLQQLQAAFKESAALDQQDTFSNPLKGSTIKALSSTEMMHEEHNKALENSSPGSMLAPLPDVGGRDVEIQHAKTRSADNVVTSEVRCSSAEITNAIAKSSALTIGSGDIVPEGNPFL